MKNILFFGMDVFEVDGFESIECESAQKVQEKLMEDKGIKFLVLPEEKREQLKLSEITTLPVVILITKSYKGYDDKKFNLILMSERTARIAIEQWRE